MTFAPNVTMWRPGTARRALALLLSLVFALFAAAPAVAQDDEAAVRAVLDKWAASYSSPDATPERMLELYDPDSVFWGTGAKTPFVGAAEIAPYFGQQFANFPERKVSFVESVIRIYGETATATGLYRFEVHTTAGDFIDVTHRFSFALNKADTGWIIVHQHSSQMPR
jgi:uncharacterized protein (TIGR02246 family)